jgi:uncharacterized membrane protein YeaQ/YmgE (transglycosylase-associated protein family)
MCILSAIRRQAAKGGRWSMDHGALVISLIIGAIVGWLAAKILKRTGFGVVGDLIVGIAGGYAGTWLWGVIPFAPEIGSFPVKEIVSSAVGAVVLLILWRAVMLR